MMMVWIVQSLPIVLLILSDRIDAFGGVQYSKQAQRGRFRLLVTTRPSITVLDATRTDDQGPIENNGNGEKETHQSSSLPISNNQSSELWLWNRKSFLSGVAASTTALLLCQEKCDMAAHAAVGTLPEFADTNVILQGITINVAEPAQQDAMIDFLVKAFDFQVLRASTEGSITNTWLGFGPEQLSIPSDFQLPVSSFNQYGGHASIHIRYDALSPKIFYRSSDSSTVPPGDNIAYLQVGVPTYRISQMTKTGAKVLDAYGVVNVISPSGLPMRGIVGIAPDPIMFVAIACDNVEQSRDFYQQLGFTEQEYPYCRPGRGMGIFEPAQPKGSVYMAPSANSMGVLLLSRTNIINDDDGGGPWNALKATFGGASNNKNSGPIKPNPVIQGLNLVYTPKDDNDASPPSIKDPSQVNINFESASTFTRLEKATRLPQSQ